MSYNTAIPNIGDFLSLSQKQQLANYAAINQAFLADHVALTAVEDVGMHNALTFRPQPIHPATTATQSALYNKLVSVIPQLFFRPSNSGTPIQLTNLNLNTKQTGASLASQSSFLAGPFTIYFGYLVACPNLQAVVLTPATTLIYVGLSTIPASPVFPTNINIAAPENIVANTFTVRYEFAPALPPTIYYMAIGI